MDFHSCCCLGQHRGRLPRLEQAQTTDYLQGEVTVTISSLVKAVENFSSRIHVEVLYGEVRVGGSTYSVKGKLKLLGFQWDPKKREWYYPTQESGLGAHEFESFTD